MVRCWRNEGVVHWLTGLVSVWRGSGLFWHGRFVGHMRSNCLHADICGWDGTSTIIGS